MNERKSWKYRLLRHAPGALGRRYRRKHEILALRTAGFIDAVNCSSGMICIDLGANVGKYTRMMAAKAKHVIAFEPDPWAHAALQANLAAFDNVSIEQAAAGTSDDTVCLYRAVGFERDPATRSQWSSTVAEKRNVAKNAALEVRQIDFVRYLDELDRKVGILKIDIEGAEVDLLEALFDRPDLLERIGHIFAETHETGIPGHRARVEALRERAKLIDRSRIFLDWG